MKTKLYVEPGTELDWDNENHRRYIEEEAFADVDKHPKPTMRPPERSPWWWFWRTFGFFVYMPARKYLMRYLDRRWVNSVYGEFARPGYWVYKWPLASPIKTWIEHGPSKGRRAFWLRALLAWLTEINVYDQCTWCGFTDWGESITVYDRHGDGRDIDMFEFVEGGGVDYWGEGQDAYGWKWCYRCGAHDWDAA